jgi:hypothetical protein
MRLLKHIERYNTNPIYIKGDLLVKKRKDDYWFDHLIILGIDTGGLENIYELYTSDGKVTERTVEWVQLNYERPDENETT